MALEASDNAGVIPQTNWNDLDIGATGSLSGGVIFPAKPLVDNTGAASGISISTTITTGYAANRQVTTASSANLRMMAGALYLRAADAGTIQFSGISPALQAEKYDVIVYFEANSQPRDISVTLGNTTAEGLDQSVFSGTFVEGTGANVDSSYLRFSGLSAASFSMTVGTINLNPRAGVTGIQIVPKNYVPLEITSFTASPNQVTTATQSIALNWNVTGATTVSINQGVGNVQASGTTTVTPGGDKIYTITATNASGSVTKDIAITLVNYDSPNIVIFIVDDFGWQDTSYQFWNTQTLWNQLYRTPGMERLAAEGRAFTNAYSAGPVCSASRISIMLGQSPVRHGTTFITGLAGGNTNTLRSANQDNVGIGPEKSSRSLPKLLARRGYRSINVGKAHFGPSDPLEVGFERNRYGGANGGPNGDGANVYQQIVNGSEIHLSEALTLAAEEEIDSSVAAGRPFFLYMSHYAVHTPILGDNRFTANYPSVTGATRSMATLIEVMDKSLNDLIDHLESKGIAEKTLIFFMSDHGGLSYRNGTSFYDDPPAPYRKFNWPLRGGKNDAYEGGIRIPFYVSWAKNDPTEPFQQALPITAGTKEDRTVIHTDLLPTILKLTGNDRDIPAVADGKDFSGFITGDEQFVRENKFFWHAPNYWLSNIAKPDSAMRDGDFKIIYTYDTGVGEWELFNLANDIGEQNNLMATDPEVGVRMARELIQYLESENANYPILTSSNAENPPTMPTQATLVDLDGDGLKDSEEDKNNNGIVDPGETDPDNDDSDDDGTKDGAEIEVGTDPLNAQSIFNLTPSTLANGNLQITWPSSPGATFTINSSIDLVDWTTVVVNGVTASAGTTTSYNLGLPSAERRFYRVTLESP